MQDYIIITDNPIEFEQIKDIFKENFPNFIICNFCNESLFMQKKGNKFEIEFSKDRLSDPESMMEETIDKCPNKNAYLTNIYVSSIDIAIRVFETLSKIIPLYWIQSDEEDNWFGTNIEFINKHKK